MSAEFAIRFLGRVPIDVCWGALVEEGKRPVYGGVNTARGDTDEEEENGRDGERDRAEIVEGGNRDPAALVDKYRSCSLRPVFEDITRDLVSIIEQA